MKSTSFSSHNTVFLNFRDLNKGLALLKRRVERACIHAGGLPGKLIGYRILEAVSAQSLIVLAHLFPPGHAGERRYSP